MNVHRLYSAMQATERALYHLKSVWMQTDGIIARTQSAKQSDAELKHAGAFLDTARHCVDNALASITPEEVPPKPEEK